MNSGRVFILEEVTSTQDAALEHDLQIGDACVSFSQTQGRGRRGAAWNSIGGVAVTVVLAEITQYFSIAIAASLALRLNSIVPSIEIGIKWPNDLYIEGKKFAGILIEQRANRILVGIGVNVYECPLDSATALAMYGFKGTKKQVAKLICSSVFDAIDFNEGDAVTEWRTRDILIGTTQKMKTGNHEVEGIVLEIDPCHNLLLETAAEILTLPAATTSVVTPCQ